MIQTKLSLTIDKHKMVEQFNKDTKLSSLYEERRKIDTTQTMFFDDDILESIHFKSSSISWCEIPSDLDLFLSECENPPNVIHFENIKEAKYIHDEKFINKCKGESRKLLSLLANLYCDSYLNIFDAYGRDKQEHIKTICVNLKEEFKTNIDEIIAKPSIIAVIKRKLKSSREKNIPLSLSYSFVFPKKRENEEVLKLKKEGKYSVNDICTLCKISLGKYYGICKKEKIFEENKIDVNKTSIIKSFLKGDEILFIKSLADDPHKSFSVPEMCEAFHENFGFPVSKKVIYYHLTKTLGYSYKRNHFKPIPAFLPSQHVVNYKVCKSILNFWEQKKILICIDESGFNLGVQKEYSYSPLGEHPYRMGKKTALKFNIIMAITPKEIFAYQIRKGCFNEHSFASFIIDLTTKICKFGYDYISKVVLFLDNAPFHKSQLVMKLLNLLPFPVLFNASYQSDLNPIESVFGIIKGKLKKQNCTSS